MKIILTLLSDNTTESAELTSSLSLLLTNLQSLLPESQIILGQNKIKKEKMETIIHLFFYPYPDCTKVKCYKRILFYIRNYFNHCCILGPLDSCCIKKNFGRLLQKKINPLLYLPLPICKTEDDNHNFSNMGPYILSVLSMNDPTGCDFLLSTYLLIHKKISWPLILVGDHSLKNKIHTFSQSHNLMDHIIFYSRIETSQKLRLIQNSSVYINPHRSILGCRNLTLAAIHKVPVMSVFHPMIVQYTENLLQYYNTEDTCYCAAIKLLKLIQSPPTEDERNEISMRFTNKLQPLKLAQSLKDQLAPLLN